MMNAETSCFDDDCWVMKKSDLRNQYTACLCRPDDTVVKHLSVIALSEEEAEKLVDDYYKMLYQTSVPRGYTWTIDLDVDGVLETTSRVL